MPFYRCFHAIDFDYSKLLWTNPAEIFPILMNLLAKLKHTTICYNINASRRTQIWFRCLTTSKTCFSESVIKADFQKGNTSVQVFKTNQFPWWCPFVVVIYHDNWLHTQSLVAKYPGKKSGDWFLWFRSVLHWMILLTNAWIWGVTILFCISHLVRIYTSTFSWNLSSQCTRSYNFDYQKWF